jgi:CRISPR system Cascade subunit CasC
MTTFIELHALRSFPPSNLNRDDLGSPKTAVFGGARRLRISSQCLKRTWRMSEHFRGCFAEQQLGIRTNRMPEEVLHKLGKVDDAVREGLLALLASIGKKDAKRKPDDDEEPAEGEEETKHEEVASAPPARTAHLLFLSRQEIDEVAKFAGKKAAALAKVMKKAKVDQDGLKKLRKELTEYLDQSASRNAVDIGLFGRFVTSDEIESVDAALQVAHGLGTQKIEVEYDYFTAVDDLGDEPGAGHLGETEFASSVLYLYSCCDLAQLEKNLACRTCKGDGSIDEEAKTLARRSLPALVRAMAEATPKGKKTGTAPYTPAEYVEVVVRRGAPLSFANAFSKPVDPRERSGDAMAASIARLVKHRDCIEAAYGRDKDVLTRLVLCLRDVDAASASAKDGLVKSIDELAQKLATALASTPAQAQR